MPKRKKTKSAKRMKEIPQTIGETKNLDALARDIVVSYDARVKVVGEIVEDTHRMMDDFREKREHMSKELKEHLAKNESLRKKDFDRMMANIILKQNEREGQVKKMLADFRQEEEMVAEKLKNLLKKGESIRIKDFKKMMDEIKREQDRRVKKTSTSITNELQNMRKEVYKMLDNLKEERQSVATAWHETIGLLRQDKIEANPGDPDKDCACPPVAIAPDDRGQIKSE